MTRTAAALLVLLALLVPAGADGPPDEEFDGPAEAFGTGAFDPADRDRFEQVDRPDLPAFNGVSCVECHNNPVTGGGNPGVTELRVGRPGDFRLVHTHGGERVPAGFDLRELRVSPPLFGLGLVEKVPEEMILAVARGQSVFLRGEAVRVEGGKIGRFGWKGQHATLLAFAADAELNEKGVTGADAIEDVPAYDRFMRALDPPPPDFRVLADPRWARGRETFFRVGCGVCHYEAFDAGGTVIRPYSDFLLHDVGTGGGIVQTEPTGRKFRTAPLWGLRVRSRLMHDGATFTRHEAILRHAGEAAGVAAAYRALSAADQRLLQIFLRGL